MACARAGRDLLGELLLANHPAAIGMDLDMAVALSLAAAFIAGAPHFPLTPEAIHASAGGTWLERTRLRHHQRSIAVLAGIVRVVLKIPLADPLSGAAGNGTDAPLLPHADLAVHRNATAATRIIVAWGGLLQCTLAPSAVLLAMHGDDARTPLDASTRSGAATPGLPLAEDTVDVRSTRDMGIAGGVLHRHANWWLAALIGLAAELS